LYEALLASAISVIYYTAAGIFSCKSKNYDRVAFYVLLGTFLLIVPITWFISAGSTGSVVYFFLIAVIATYILAGERRFVLIAIAMSVFLILLYIEYLYPALLIEYDLPLYRYLDIGIYSMISMITSIYYMNIYYREFKETNEKLIKKTEELEKANKAKDKFYSIIAHDLKNPFNTIIGFSNLLYQSSQNNDYNNVKEYSKYMVNTGEETYKLLLNLLEWSQVNSAGIKYRPEKISLSKIINEQIPLFYHAARTKNNKIKLEIEDYTLYADKNGFKTIMRNLVTNAIKFTDNGEIVITNKIKGDRCEIIVKDTGVGMDKDTVKNLFATNKTTPGTSGEHGTGIGLQLCREFVEMGGGSLKVDSNPGKGSAFSFSLQVYKNNSTENKQ
jgi:signal transduction histidine kinase